MNHLNAVIDLSHHNAVQSLQPAKDAGILGVIHKATQGTAYVDPSYVAHRALARQAGLLWGAYHFGVAGNVDQQVDHFLTVAEADESDIVVLDFENNSQGATMSVAEAEDFVGQLFIRRGGYPGLYSGQSFLAQKLRGRTDSVLGNCFLWIARYSDNAPVVPPSFANWSLWQYTDGTLGPEPHEVPGIGRCDRDTFNGDAAALLKFWGAVAPVA